MKKQLFFFGLLIFATNAAANPSNDTILNVKKAGHVIVTRNDSTLSIDVRGKESDSTYRYSYTMSSRGDNSTLISERSEKWDFSIALGKKSPKGHCENVVTMGGIGFGLVTALNAPEGMDIDMAASREIYADLIGVSRFMRNRKHRLSISFGINWRNFRMTGKNRFDKVDNDIVIGDYPEGASIQFSRIKVFSLTVPLRYKYRFAKDFCMDLSAILNFNTYASIKTRYKMEGHKVKEMEKNIHQRPLSVDFSAGLQWRSIGAYVKYSPCDVINHRYGPKFQPLSTGITLFF